MNQEERYYLQVWLLRTWVMAPTERPGRRQLDMKFVPKMETRSLNSLKGPW